MAENKVTHIIDVYPSQESEMLFRASDGICIGMRKKETVVFGDEPNKRNSHVFIDGMHAKKWMETVLATRDLKEHGGVGLVELEFHDKESVISLAGGEIGFPSSAPRPIKN